MHEPHPGPDDAEAQLTVTSRTQAHAIVVAAAGEIDVLTAPRLSAALEPALRRAAIDNVIVCDLAGVTFLASHGIELLLHATEQAQEMGRTLRVVIAPGQTSVSRSLELTGVDRALALYPSLDEAVNGRR